MLKKLAVFGGGDRVHQSLRQVFIFDDLALFAFGVDDRRNHFGFDEGLIELFFGRKIADALNRVAVETHAQRTKQRIAIHAALSARTQFDGIAAYRELSAILILGRTRFEITHAAQLREQLFALEREARANRHRRGVNARTGYENIAAQRRINALGVFLIVISQPSAAD